MKKFDREFCKYIEDFAIKEMFFDGVLIADENGIVRYMRSYKENVIPFTEREALGKHITELYVDIDREQSTLLNVIKGIPTINRETRQTTYNGIYCVFVENTIPVRFEGQIIGAASFIKFVTSYQEEVRVKSDTKTKRLYNSSDIIGEDHAIVHLKEMIGQVAYTDSSVLIFGETGTGKELVAQSIHSQSRRSSGSFIAQNCSAIPNSLLEGLLFGTVKGSFTGAENRPGIFELANGGTLFLDEINSMDMEMQAKILKVIEEKKVKRLGSDKERDLDIRIVAAMNENPLACMKRGGIREDLFYRIAAVQLQVPSLRERRSDIPLLIEHFIHMYNGKMDKHIDGVMTEVMEFFTEYDWPGNVRELRNAIEGAFNFTDERFITIDALPSYLMRMAENGEGQSEKIEESKSAGKVRYDRIKSLPAQEQDSDGDLKSAVEKYEKAYIESRIPMAGSLNELAEMLNISRQNLRYKLKKYGIVLEKKLSTRD